MNHPINMDAIQAGVEAFLETYPDEAALDALSPTSGPKGAHAVLWMDDWWRGVDMAREALESADFCAKLTTRYPTEHLRTAACRAAVYAMENDWELPPDLRAEIDAEAVEVFVCQVGSLIVNGDADWHAKTDPETVADRAEPAGPFVTAKCPTGCGGVTRARSWSDR